MSLTFTPSNLQYSTLSKEVLQFDVSAAVTSLGGTSARLPTAVLTDLQADTPVSGIAAPTVIASTIILLQIDGSLLQANHTYQLVIGFTASSTTNVAALKLTITTPF